MYENYLNTENAQKIADGIMKIIPCNINITDTAGEILASGDKSTLGTLHKGALTALKRKEAYVIYENTPTEQRGICLPIIYNNSILGVIAIGGDVEEVMPIGQICLSIAVLTIENRLLSDMSSIKESRLKDFLYEWISLSREQYDDAFYDQAAYLGIDMKIPRTAVVITSSRIRYSIIKTIKSHLAAGEYIARQGMEEVLILFRSDKRLKSRLEKILDISKDLENCYIGESDIIASRTTNSVMQTFHIARALNIRRRILCYHEVSLECLLNNVEVTRELEEILKLLKERDVDGVLKETIAAYVEDNDNYAQICDKLHIHRNTLNYRLAKIEELLNRNPRRAKDLMMLYIAVIKMGGNKEKR